MYVCICRGVTDSQIRQSVTDGCTSLRQVSKQLGVASCCGKCGKCAKQIIKDTLADTAAMENLDLVPVAV